jgi:tetratricopeptide (TPR) repeat protein
MHKKEKNVIEFENTLTFEDIQKSGDYYTSECDYDNAQRCYEKAASLNPDAPAPYIGLGIIAFQKDLLEDAQIAFRVACRLSPNSWRAYTGLAMIAQKKAEYEKAFEFFLKSLELNTDNLTALLGLFQTSCQMGSFAKVIHYLDLYLSTHPNDCSVMFTLAALYVKENRFEDSKNILMNILKLEPLNQDAINLLEEVERNIAKKQPAGV